MMNKNIVCIGAGYIGGPTMAVIALKNPSRKVYVVDINQARIDAWNSDNLPIYEPGLEEIVRRVRGKNLFFTTDIEGCIKKCDIVFVGVNTPTKMFGKGAGRASDLQYWEATARTIKRVATSDKIVVEKSTLPVRTAAAMKAILDAEEKAKSEGEEAPHFEVLSNPEFLAEGTAIKDLLEPDRVLIGGDRTPTGEAAVQALVDVYLGENGGEVEKVGGGGGGGGGGGEQRTAPSVSAAQPVVLATREHAPSDACLRVASTTEENARHTPSPPALFTYSWVPRERILTTNVWSAELTKLAANAFLAQRVSSINAIAGLCEATGADVDEVARVIGADRRIGPKFLKAGPGFGGSCFKKDVLNLVYLCESFGLHTAAEYWTGVIKMNDHQQERIVSRLFKEMFNTLANKKIAMFGFAFKADTGDTRETPAGSVARLLNDEHVRLAITDPKALDNARADLADIVEDPEDAVRVDGGGRRTCASIPAAQPVVLATRGHTPSEACLRVASTTDETARHCPPALSTSPSASSRITFEADPYAAARDADAVLLMTDWKLYPALDWQRIYDSMRKPALVFDTRNCLDAVALRKLGFKVLGIGK